MMIESGAFLERLAAKGLTRFFGVPDSLLAGLVASTLGPQYRTWAMICLLPLTFAGLALVHARGEYRGWGSGTMAAFYVLWLLFDMVKLIVVFAAIADSWFDFRQRWQQQDGEAPKE